MSLALTDSLVCIEMPFFAIAHVSPGVSGTFDQKRIS